MTTDTELAADSNQFVLTVDLMAEYFVDGFLLVQDLYSGRNNISPGNSKLFQNFYVNVGNDPDGRNNPSCPNAPFMTIANDGSSQSGHFYDPKYRRWIWRYGTERPCNLFGRYVSIIADYSAIAMVGSYEIALCQWGVLGNRIVVPEEVQE